MLETVWTRNFLVAVVGVLAIVFGWSEATSSEIANNVVMIAGVAATLYGKVTPEKPRLNDVIRGGAAKRK